MVILEGKAVVRLNGGECETVGLETVVGWKDKSWKKMTQIY